MENTSFSIPLFCHAERLSLRNIRRCSPIANEFSRLNGLEYPFDVPPLPAWWDRRVSTIVVVQYYVSQKRKSDISIALLNPRVSSTTFPRRWKKGDGWTRLLSLEIWFEWTDDYTERDIRCARDFHFPGCCCHDLWRERESFDVRKYLLVILFLLKRLSSVERRVQGFRKILKITQRERAMLVWWLISDRCVCEYVILVYVYFRVF